MSVPPPAAFLLGPTASGKSEAGLLLAESLGGTEILSLDAMAVYRGMDVATAKPSPAARLRVPHHGVDLAEPTEEFHLGAFLSEARRVLADASARGKRILALGGTGFYLHRLREGLFEGPGADWAMRAELEARAEREGPEALHAELNRLDPSAATGIKPQDLRRTMRALEVCLGSGKPMTQWRREGTRGGISGGILLGIRRTPEDLKRRIDLRVEAMFAGGIVEETKRVAAAGLSHSASQALGTKEVLGMLEGRYGETETRDLVRRRTWQFARRQGTWFRRFPEIRWVDAAGNETAESLAERLLAQLRDAEAKAA